MLPLYRKTNALRDRITSLTVKTPNYRIPNETLRTIFTYTLAPAFLVDPTTSFSPASSWLLALRAKKALTLVCRAWSPVAIEILYEEVNIRRLTQMTHLIALFQSRHELGSMVKRLILSCFVPEDSLDEYNTYLSLLRDLCPRVNSLHPSTLTWAEHSKAASIPATLESLTQFSNVVDLKLNTGIFAQDLLRILRHAEKLKSLSFELDSGDGEKEELPLTHSCLETFVTVWKFVDYNSVLLPSLSLPKLTHLTIHWNSHDTDNVADKFVQRNGRNLVYLDLNYCTNFNVNLFNKLIEQSLSLRHLVLYNWPGDSQSVLQLIHHPNIKYIDVWDHDQGLSETTKFDLSQLTHSSHLPRLENIRRLDGALITLLRLPLEFPPEEHYLYKDRPSRFLFPGIDVEVCENYVQRNDMEYLTNYGEQVAGPFAYNMGGSYRPLHCGGEREGTPQSRNSDHDCPAQDSSDEEIRSEDSSDTEDSFTGQLFS